MKFKYLSCLAVSALLAFSACKKKDDGNDDNTNNTEEVNGVDRNLITEGNYDPKETPTEKYLRIMRTFSSTQSSTNSAAEQGASSNTSAQKKAQFEDIDICSSIEQSFSDFDSEGCFKQYMECEEKGKIVRYVSDYGTVGCNAGDQILVGKIIYTFHDMFNMDFGIPDEYSDYADYATKTAQSTTLNGEYEIIGFGELSRPKVNGTGTNKTVGQADGSSVTDTEAEYEVIAANEILTADAHFESESASTYASEDLTTWEIFCESDKGYEIDMVTTSEILYKSECALNQETLDTRYPVKGTEKITITENGEVTVLDIDYGDGTCDMLFTITDKDGNTVTSNFNYELID